MAYSLDFRKHVFHAWVVQELLPNTPKNSVIVLDNATFHKRSGTLQAIEEAGHAVAFLPPYSPDLNPIEKKWAQAKSIRKNTTILLMNFFYILICDVLYLFSYTPNCNPFFSKIKVTSSIKISIENYS